MNIIRKIIIHYTYLKQIIVNMLRRLLYEEPTYTAPTAKSLTYNGSAQALLNAGSTSHGYFEYSSDGSTWSTTIPTGTNAGNYTPQWRLIGDGWHSCVIAKSVSVNIAKKQITCTAPTPKSNLVYNFVSQALINAGSCTGGTMYYSGASNTSYNTAIPTAVDVDSYIINWKCEATNSNYSGTCSGSITGEISCSACTVVTAPTPKTNLVYNGSAHALVNAGVASNNCVINYKCDDDDFAQDTVPTKINAGTYIVKYWAGGEVDEYSFCDSSTGQVTVSIAKASRTLSWSSAPTPIGVGNSSQLLAVPSAGSGDGTITYSSSNSNVASVNGNTVSGVSSGTCTITASISQGTNYNAASTSYTLTIEAQESRYLTFVATDSGTFKFSKNEIAYKINNGSWTTLAANTNTPTVYAGDRIMWKAVRAQREADGHGTFSSTGRFTAEGNIMSIIYGDDFSGQTSVRHNWAFYNLFRNCIKLTNINNLSIPATTLEEECYYGMFAGCTSLTTIPSGLLPATSLAEECYQDMFAGCTSLTTIPSGLLPATTMSSYCYVNMFADCTSLTTIPSGLLPATSLASYCYYGMFTNCTSLTTIPSNMLPATTLAQSCYQAMFYNCTGLTTVPSDLLSITNISSGLGCYYQMFAYCRSLTTAPSLPATTLSQSCYNQMFAYCSSLTTAPSLPATTLVTECYKGMFKQCTSLVTAPVLPARNLVSRCYDDMFNNCTSLTSITSIATSSNIYDCAWDWTYKVSANGVFTKDPRGQWPSGEDGVPTNWTVRNYFTLPQAVEDVMYDGNSHALITAGSVLNGYGTLKYSLDASTWSTSVPTATDPGSYNVYWKLDGTPTMYSVETNVLQANIIGTSGTHLTFTAIENCTFKFTSATNYSINNGSWTSLAANTNVSVSSGSKIRWKATITPVKYAGVGTFSSTGRFTAMGNPASLISGDSFTSLTTLPAYAFKYMFSGCTGITSAEYVGLQYNATASGGEQFCHMFSGCTSLTVGPAYYNIGTVNGISLCKEMFYGCTSLTRAMPTMDSTVLNFHCENMFKGCSSLTTPPTLPATSLAQECYFGMFRNCTSLVTAPDLPAKTLIYYCYDGMFRGCTNLNYIKAMFTTNISAQPTDYTENWVLGVADSGTFVKNVNAIWGLTGVNGIPSGWSVQTASS